MTQHRIKTNGMTHHHIETNGVTLHVVEMGEGPVVLFVHGFPDTWRGWRRQIEAVVAAGYRAVALDMRGYGESSAPEDGALYTIFYSVGDLIGVLDFLAVNSAVVVGHDFGAAIAWNAAMMRPDRFRAVFALSVPPIVPTAKSFFQQIREAGLVDFYMFRQMRPEADAEWADAETTLAGMYYWTSGQAPEETRWDPLDPARGLTRPAPMPRPSFVDLDDFNAAIADFQRNGFHAPLNYYRAIQPYFDMAHAFVGTKITQPSFFLVGNDDGMERFRTTTRVDLDQVLTDLRGFVKLDGIGHWPQLEATEVVNDRLVQFLNEIG